MSQHEDRKIRFQNRVSVSRIRLPGDREENMGIFRYENKYSAPTREQRERYMKGEVEEHHFGPDGQITLPPLSRSGLPQGRYRRGADPFCRGPGHDSRSRRGKEAGGGPRDPGEGFDLVQDGRSYAVGAVTAAVGFDSLFRPTIHEIENLRLHQTVVKNFYPVMPGFYQ